MGYPCGSAGKESACNAGDLGLIPGSGRSPGEGKGYRLQCSGLENRMDCIVHGVTKSQTWLSDFRFYFLVAHMVSLQCRRRRFDPWIRKTPWRRKWQPTPVFLPRKFHGWRSLVPYSPRVCKESDITEWLTHTHATLCICQISQNCMIKSVKYHRTLQ